MNIIKYIQEGGFPLDTNNLNFLQNCFRLLNSLGDLAGEKTIISGCKIAGNTISNGVVYLNGEILEFRGGTIGANVIIKEEAVSGTFENGSFKAIEITRYLTFGTSTPEKTFAWAEFKSFDNLVKLSEEKAEKKELDKSIKRIEKLEEQKPMIGEIKQGIFDINNLPPGWFLCDGQNGTPDLRDYFLRGKNDSRALGSFQEDAQQRITGGFASTINASGRNPYGSFEVGSHYSTEIRGGGKSDAWGKNITFDSSQQVRTADENRPKNYAVYFIIYLGVN
ncbi:MAG: hypothetical protein Q4A00_05535 [Flavobacteriaceae bacterium]|nr:hypothetical protein [Flavobacteriaceae bacterium]